MKKEEFLTKLRSQLVGLPESDVEERIEFYSEAIDDRIEEGQTEEEAVRAVGGVDEAVTKIAEETPMSKLVIESINKRKRMSGLEIVLLILGFPLWFPLLLTAFILCFVFYLLIWVFVLVAWAIEASLIAEAFGSLVVFFYGLSQGNFEPMYLGIFTLSVGLSIAFFFACIEFTKLGARLSRAIIRGIKKKFMRRGNKR